MSEEERKLVPGEAPDVPPELPEVQPLEAVLTDKLAETADEVKSGLQDLLPAQPPVEPAAQLPAELPAEPADQPPVELPIEPAEQLPVDLPAEPAELPSVEPSAETIPPMDQGVEVIEREAEPIPTPPEVEPAPPLQEEPAAAGLPPAPAAAEATKLVSSAAVESTSDDRLMSMLAWLTMAILQLPIVSIIQLVSTGTKDRAFQRHHAIMSLMFYVVGIAYEIVAAILFVILSTLTLGCGAACLWIIFLVPQAFALYFALQAYNGKLIELPVLSNFARQQGWL